jgi:excisionase family DNA binding protein
MNKSNRFYTIEEATNMLGISEQEVINMITLKKLPAIKVEKAIKIREEDLEKFLDSLGRKDTTYETGTGNTTEIPVEEETEKKDRIEECFKHRRMELEKSYKDLLRKKQELEEDINYLQYKYDEFKNRIKQLISEELKLFLKKIDEENLKEGNEILQNNFNDNLDINEDIEKATGNDEYSDEDEEEALLLQDNGEDEKKLTID